MNQWKFINTIHSYWFTSNEKESRRMNRKQKESTGIYKYYFVLFNPNYSNKLINGLMEINRKLSMIWTPFYSYLFPINEYESIKNQ